MKDTKENVKPQAAIPSLNDAPTRFEAPIYVTSPFLPPLEEFTEGLKGIWQRKRLTNNGPVLQCFNEALSSYLGVRKVSLFANGTLALQIGLQGLGITGEVITTPFSFVATTHALYWNKIRPVFCDIEPEFYTLDPEQVEAAITPWTTAILAVHVFGYPCNVDALSDIARRHNLKLIFDAAHAFGVNIKGDPIAKFGNLSMFSFHATKLFHSIEGGMLVTNDTGLISEVDYLKNFGFKNETEVVMPGTNAKMNEFQALMGLNMLKYMPVIIATRKSITARYRKRLEKIPGIHIPPQLNSNIESNYAYMSIEVIESEYGISRDQLYEKLREYNVYTRRYFFPLICDFSCYKKIPVTDTLTVARRVASQILTLPIYPDLKPEHVEKICDLIEYFYKPKN